MLKHTFGRAEGPKANIQRQRFSLTFQDLISRLSFTIYVLVSSERNLNKWPSSRSTCSRNKF